MTSKRAADNWNWLDAIAKPLDDDFVQAALDQPLAIERREVEFLTSRSARLREASRSRSRRRS